MNIIDAMEAPEMFAPLFAPRSPRTPASFEGDTWAAWKAMLRGLFALPMSDDVLATYSKHTGLSAAPTTAFNRAAIITGRRGGKSRILAMLGVFLATMIDYGDRVAPGETPTVAVIASDRKQARAIFRYVRALLASVDALASLIESETADSIMLTNGVAIEVHTASFRSTRGLTLIAALCDEVAFWREGDAANPDEEIINALEPALGTLDGLLLIASTAYAKRGILYQWFKEHHGCAGSDTMVWRGSTREMNPDFPQSKIDQAYADDAAKASAEFGAEFRDDVAGYVTREVIDACTVPGRYELPPISTVKYCGFVDPSGGSSDSMTLAIAHKEQGRAVLDALREVKPPFSPEQVVADFCALLKSYRVAKVRGNRYAGEWCREPFRKLAVSYDLSDRAKSDLYRDLLPQLNSGQAELLDLPRLTKQFCDLERRTARGGRDSIDHAPGAHDDVANAVAGALLEAAGGRGPLVISDALLERSARPARRFNLQRTGAYW